MKNNYDFIGIGWSFPPEFNKANQTVKTVSGPDEINQSLEILLSTSLGERFLQPTYGCDLKHILFESVDASLKIYLKNLVETAIIYHEPRIRLDNITITNPSEDGIISIIVDYTISNTNSRFNYVYPFYLER